jgi:UDP-GlcNAc:undecaprenyl-phosphate/decaprenyl-phosphate GlcNAc-1-phosphate transferase
MLWYDLIPLPVAFVASLILVNIIIKVSHKYAIYDYPGQHKRHNKPTPHLGGTAILLASWLAIIISLKLSPESFSGIKPVIPNIFLGSLLIYFIGVIDDFHPVPAWGKLSAQVIAGLILYSGGLSIKLVSLPIIGSTSVDGFSVVITVLWVVALSNAINLIDGLDGLAAGVSIIAYASMAVIGMLYAVEAAVVISLALTGAIFAFWLYNRYPAKIFMGDNGALLIGYFFAVVSLAVPIKSYTTAALFMPLVALAVPLIEALSSFTRRLMAGQNVMTADRRHIFHYLSYAGLNQKQVVYLFYLSGLFFGIISVGMFVFERMLLLTILLLFMVVILVLYFIFIFRMKRGRQPKG